MVNLTKVAHGSESVKRAIRHVKNLGLWHDLPTSVNGRVISPLPEGFIFIKHPIGIRKTS